MLIGAMVVATVLLKSVGPVLTGGRTIPVRLLAVIAATPAALLAALVVTGTLTDDRGDLTFGADAVGVAAASAVVWKTGSVLHAIAVALVVTGGLRAVT